MPSAKEGMYSALSGNAEIVAVVGSKVFPDAAPQTLDGQTAVDEPYLVFQSVSDVAPLSFNRKIAIRKVRFQITAYGTRAETQAIHTALESLLHGKKNQSYGGVDVDTSFLSTDEGAVDEDEVPRPGEESGLRVLRADVTWWVR